MNTVKNFRIIHLQLAGCVAISNSLNDLSNKVCIPNKTEDLNLRVFNMIAGINELKTNDMSCKCKCKRDRKKN